VKFAEDIAPGIDEIMLRQPVGVCATIAPFNFPGMIPFWYLPYALACRQYVHYQTLGKSSDDHAVDLQADRAGWLSERRYQPGQWVERRGGCHPGPPGRIGRSPSSVRPTWRSISTARAAENGKRVQAQGGAKNPVIILPDADMEMATKIIADSAFGCAGQRCLAVSLAVTVAEARNLHRVDL
jgi:malonate-semialdehyde dehydrogenase (acetylating) / methylmalonate-semialdehyde dehydrogenase